LASIVEDRNLNWKKEDKWVWKEGEIANYTIKSTSIILKWEVKRE